jgi:hypothetical protein
MQIRIATCSQRSVAARCCSSARIRSLSGLTHLAESLDQLLEPLHPRPEEIHCLQLYLRGRVATGEAER